MILLAGLRTNKNPTCLWKCAKFSFQLFEQIFFFQRTNITKTFASQFLVLGFSQLPQLNRLFCPSKMTVRQLSAYFSLYRVFRKNGCYGLHLATNGCSENNQCLNTRIALRTEKILQEMQRWESIKEKRKILKLFSWSRSCFLSLFWSRSCFLSFFS